MRRTSQGSIGVGASLVVAALLAGCSSPTVRWYSLDPTPAAGAAPAAAVPMPAAADRARAGAARTALIVGTVSVPETLDRTQWVVRTGPQRVQVLEYERWTEPLGGMLQHAIARRLVARLPGVQVVTSSDAVAARSPWRLTVNVLAFDATPGEGTALVAAWALEGSGDRRIARRSSIEQPLSGPGYDAIAAAHARALDALCDEIAAAATALSEPSSGSSR